jgi:hypothetical protein
MITVDDLATAIEAGIHGEERKLMYDEAFDLAQHVLNFFGYSNRIIDNVLEPEDRDTFYMLEDAGILTTEREEITLYDGREWRIHYWLFKNEKIQDLINNIKPVQEEVVEETDLYKELPREAWIKHVEEDEE